MILCDVDMGDMGVLLTFSLSVSYDVHKDGVKVAVLTFIKSAFRLGETIQGVVELNERSGRARVVQVSTRTQRRVVV